MQPSLQHYSAMVIGSLDLLRAWSTGKLVAAINRISKWIYDLMAIPPRPAPIIPGLKDSLWQASRELDWAQNIFNEVTDTEMTDYAIYQIQAAQNKYRHYLKKLRFDAKTRLPAFPFRSDLPVRRVSCVPPNPEI